MTELSISPVARTLVSKIIGGWTPSLLVGRPVSCRFKDHELRADRVAILGDRVNVYLSDVGPDLIALLRDAKLDETSLIVQCSDDSELQISALHILAMRGVPTGLHDVTIEGQEWIVTHRHKPPACLIAQLRGMPPSVPGNLDVHQSTKDPGEFSDSYGHIVLEGAAQYILLRSSITESWHVLIPRASLPSFSDIDKDVAALALGVGRRLHLEKWHGVDEAYDTVSQWSRTFGDGTSSSSAESIPLVYPRCLLAPFFARVSGRLRSDQYSPVRIAISYYLDSLRGNIHARILLSTVALESLARSVFNELDPNNEPDGVLSRHGSWHSSPPLPRAQDTISAALKHYNLTPPTEALGASLAIRNGIAHRGMFLKDYKAEVADLLVALNGIYRMASALIARHCGYTGVLADWSPGIALGVPPATAPMLPDRWWSRSESPDNDGIMDTNYLLEYELDIPRSSATMPVLLVEGRTDELVAAYILQAAGLAGRIEIQVADGIRGMLPLLEATSGRDVAVLLDADARSVFDATAQLASEGVRAFVAIPSVEAWLFADEIAIREVAPQHAKGLLQRLPLPEDIASPKELAHMVLGSTENWAFLAHVDITRAAARSASLRAFLEGIFEMLGLTEESARRSGFRSFSRDLLSSLLAEVAASDSVAWRTSDGRLFTADELRREIQGGSENGQQYATDLLRVARDFLAGRAKARPK